jgi:hypothetical protein
MGAVGVVGILYHLAFQHCDIMLVHHRFPLGQEQAHVVDLLDKKYAEGIQAGDASFIGEIGMGLIGDLLGGKETGTVGSKGKQQDQKPNMKTVTNGRGHAANIYVFRVLQSGPAGKSTWRMVHLPVQAVNG